MGMRLNGVVICVVIMAFNGISHVEAEIDVVTSPEKKWHSLMREAEKLDSEAKPLDALEKVNEALEFAEKSFGPNHLYVALSVMRRYYQMLWVGVNRMN